MPPLTTFAVFLARVASWQPLRPAGRGGLEVDHEKAYELHLNAAKRGMPRAQYNTAVQLFEGKGVQQV